MDSNKIEKLSLLAELINLARVDQPIHEMEHHFLLAIAQQLGITNEEFETLINQKVDFTPPVNEFDRILQLQRLILLSNIDLKINEKEINLIKELSVKMGLNPLAVNEVLIKMNEFENKIIPPPILIEIFARNYN